MRLLGISRSKKFSPNMAAKDEAIFKSVVTGLEKRGHEVSFLSEDLFVDPDLSEFALVFSMARGGPVLKALARAQAESSLRVINSPTAVLLHGRCELFSLFSAAGIPQPAGLVIDLGEGGGAESLSFRGRCEEGTQGSLSFPLWLKRGEGCAQASGDVCFVEREEDLFEVLADFRARAILRAVALSHVEGDLVKFYGVAGHSFFHFTYPTREGGSSKFGLEVHNSPLRYFPFDASALKACADLASEVSGFCVYGGDAVVRADGSFEIIDFNDWPSFSSCAKEASKAIVERIENELSGISSRRCAEKSSL